MSGSIFSLHRHPLPAGESQHVVSLKKETPSLAHELEALTRKWKTKEGGPQVQDSRLARLGVKMARQGLGRSLSRRLALPTAPLSKAKSRTEPQTLFRAGLGLGEAGIETGNSKGGREECLAE